jgi:hypothetical protein
MSSVGILLVLIYSGLSIAVEVQPSMAVCHEAAAKSLGEKLKVAAWDNMGGSNPIPHVVIAYCVEGIAEGEGLK